MGNGKRVRTKGMPLLTQAATRGGGSGEGSASDAAAEGGETGQNRSVAQQGQGAPHRGGGHGPGHQRHGGQGGDGSRQYEGARATLGDSGVSLQTAQALVV